MIAKITVVGGDVKRMRILQMITLAICKGERLCCVGCNTLETTLEWTSVQAMYIKNDRF